MNRWKIITDPSLPCKSTYYIDAHYAKTAIKIAILRGHDWLTKEHIGEIEKVSDESENTHVVTIKELPSDPKRHPLLSRFDWLRIPGVSFWVECIVKKVKKRSL